MISNILFNTHMDKSVANMKAAFRSNYLSWAVSVSTFWRFILAAVA